MSGNNTRGLRYSFINDETNVWIIIMIMTFVVFLALVVGVHECYRSMEKRRHTTNTPVNNSSPTTGHRNNGDIDEDSHSIATTVDDETDLEEASSYQSPWLQSEHPVPHRRPRRSTPASGVKQDEEEKEELPLVVVCSAAAAVCTEKEEAGEDCANSVTDTGTTRHGRVRRTVKKKEHEDNNHDTITTTTTPATLPSAAAVLDPICSSSSNLSTSIRHGGTEDDDTNTDLAIERLVLVGRQRRSC